MSKKIDILIVEKNALLREKIAGVLSRRDEVGMVTQISDCGIMEEAARNTRPGILLIDIRLAKSEEIAISTIRNEYPKTKIFMISEEEGLRYRAAALAIGAAGLIQATRIEDCLKDVIRSAEEEAAQNPPKRMVVEGNMHYAILVAEDDEFYRSRIRTALEANSLKHKIVASGAAALKELFSAPGRFGCVVLDVHMDSMDGIEVGSIIRRRCADMPLVYITSDENPETEYEARLLGISGFLKKPFSQKVFIETVSSATGNPGEVARSAGNSDC
jgi:DNA-binding NarL/FixJ family response regulator